MAEYNYATKEINVKIVYYGPGLCGKTTNLQYIHSSIDKENRGEMIALATKTDRTLYFDFLPIHAGTIHGFKTRFLLYTVPGQVYYDSTRKVVLRGADGVVFVADSSPDRMEANKESLRNLDTNLREHKMSLETIPWVLQFNKRDLANALGVETMMTQLNTMSVPAFRGVAITGEGVFEILHRLLGLTMKHLNKKAVDAGRAAIFGQNQKNKNGEQPDFENADWFSDMSNPPELDPNAEVRLDSLGEVSSPKSEPEPESPHFELELGNESSPEDDDLILDLPTQINLELPEEPLTANDSAPAPPLKKQAPTAPNGSKNERVLRVKKTVDLPIQLRTSEYPRQVQLNLVLNVKLIPPKTSKNN